MSDFNELYRLIKRGEDQTLDFKQQITSPYKIARTIVAFANAEGGRLLVGIDDQGEIIGVDIAQEKHMLIKAARKFCDPPIFLHFREKRAHRKTVLSVEIDKSQKEHRALDEAGRWLPFTRVADQSVLVEGLESQLEADQYNLDPIPILMEKHEGLVNFLRDNDSITIKDYMRLMNISYQVANRSLRELAEFGVLERDDQAGLDTYYLASEED